MDISLSGINASISWADGKTTVSGEEAETVKSLLRQAYGHAGRLFFLDGSPDYDLYYAAKTALAEYKPVFSRKPDIPTLPDNAIP
ncbi:hypothetical protein D0962_22665 [Leptolyngbyaceae cyanobacterium CCMR0082]|uniref:Uncharacterized protein n=1 Tax=Adonisia turfae CCMR0082 TaxID=2304604 RepID=A0A6M0SC20_9CYAN|nr:hypothetical protein [Adonisia turfae]NEZ65531.1 hypothetical protein [Adonisia turfae CCMR0082]